MQSNDAELMSSAPLFQIEGLHVAVEGQEILKGVDLTVMPGEVHALMGPNGSGKSTLANALLGNFQLTPEKGDDGVYTVQAPFPPIPLPATVGPSGAQACSS